MYNLAPRKSNWWEISQLSSKMNRSHGKAINLSNTRTCRTKQSHFSVLINICIKKFIALVPNNLKCKISSDPSLSPLKISARLSMKWKKQLLPNSFLALSVSPRANRHRKSFNSRQKFAGKWPLQWWAKTENPRRKMWEIGFVEKKKDQRSHKEWPNLPRPPLSTVKLRRSSLKSPENERKRSTGVNTRRRREARKGETVWGWRDVRQQARRCFAGGE